MLDLARPEVAEWTHGWLDRLVGEHAIDFLKWDMNRVFTEAGPGDRLWDDHVRNLYSIIDRLRAGHPGLRIESCSGGGGRVDLGILPAPTRSGRPTTPTRWTGSRSSLAHGLATPLPAGDHASAVVRLRRL